MVLGRAWSIGIWNCSQLLHQPERIIELPILCNLPFHKARDEHPRQSDLLSRSLDASE